MDRLKTLTYMLGTGFVLCLLVIVLQGSVRALSPAREKMSVRDSRNGFRDLLADFAPEFREALERAERSALPAGGQYNNPLYPEFLRIAARYGLDLSFTRNVKIVYPSELHQYERALEFPIYCMPPESLDVLIIGDSTAHWGMSPRVMEQISGLRVGMLAFRSMYLNRRSLQVAERIRRLYLKPRGLTIYAFDVWTQDQDPNIFRRGALRKLEAMTEGEFRRFARKRRDECGAMDGDENRGAAPRGEPRLEGGPIFSRETYSVYEGRLAAMRKTLRTQYGLRLPSDSRVAEAFRARINPDWFGAEKDAKKPGRRAETSARSVEPGQVTALEIKNQYMFLRWDADTLSVFVPHYNYSEPSDEPADPRMELSYNVRFNGEFLASLPGRKAYLIPFFYRRPNYVIMRSWYEQLYKGKLQLIDLGRMHPRDEGFPMDHENHMANTGGLYKSIYVGEWLKKNFHQNNASN